MSSFRVFAGPRAAAETRQKQVEGGKTGDIRRASSLRREGETYNQEDGQTKLTDDIQPRDRSLHNLWIAVCEIILQEREGIHGWQNFLDRAVVFVLRC